MLLSLSLLPIYLLLVGGVTSADFSNNKRVPRRETHIIRTYRFNHPPIEETNDKIPVSVVYDHEEVIKVINKNEEKSDVIVEDKTKLLKDASKAVNLEIPVNHPPSSDLYPLPGINDFKEKSILKPKARSIKIPVPESAETKEESVTPVKRRRVQRVRKVKVNKTQLNTYVREAQISKDKEEQKEAAPTTVRTRSEEPSSTTPQTFKSRSGIRVPVVPIPKSADASKGKEEQKEVAPTTVRTRGEAPSLRTPQTFKPRSGVRDPVVPILESESYVFSHSGAFHYSYEGGDGTKAYERGELKNSNGGSGSAVEGNFSYKDKDGNDVSLTYTADENGYRPVGAHLPTPPPIPIAIQRALAYLATKTPESTTERIRTVKKKELV